MIVLTMTSWTARIHNVASVLKTILNQTVLPDKVYLNLSKEEFENKSLPSSLTQFLNNNSLIILNWVDGPNIKAFKKIFPILKYLADDDIIINIDDDMLLPPTFIESRLKDFKKYNTCISGLQSKYLNRGYAKGRLPEVHHYLGAGSVYQKKMFNNWETLVNNEIIATNHDDAFYDFITWLNGYTPESCSEFDAHSLEDLSEQETSIHGDVGCLGPIAATNINIDRFITVYKVFPYYNFFKTNKQAPKAQQKENRGTRADGRSNAYLYF